MVLRKGVYHGESLLRRGGCHPQGDKVRILFIFRGDAAGEIADSRHSGNLLLHKLAGKQLGKGGCNGVRRGNIHNGGICRGLCHYDKGGGAAVLRLIEACKHKVRAEKPAERRGKHHPDVPQHRAHKAKGLNIAVSDFGIVQNTAPFTAPPR